MKIRWTQNSARFRITPTELKTLLAGSPITEALHLPGGMWTAEVAPSPNPTSIDLNPSGRLRLTLSPADLARLNDPNEEGVYFSTNSSTLFTYFIEKDFPCAHPRSAEAAEPECETFQPPKGFESKE